MHHKDLSIGKKYLFLPVASSLASYTVAFLNYNQERSFDLYLAEFASQHMSRVSSLQLFKALFLDHRPRKMHFSPTSLIHHFCFGSSSKSPYFFCDINLFIVMTIFA